MRVRWSPVRPRPRLRTFLLGLLSLSSLVLLVLYSSLLSDRFLPPFLLGSLHSLFLRSRHVRSYPLLRQPRCCFHPPVHGSGPRIEPGPSHQGLGLSRSLNSSPRLDAGRRPVPRLNASRSPGTGHLLLLAVKSHPADWRRREAIRSTWGEERSWGGEEVRRVFLLGEEEEEREHGVAEESDRHGDVLQWRFRESFFNVTLKEVLFWGWYRRRCSGSFRYVLKGDDDVFVDVERVVELLKNLEGGTGGGREGWRDKAAGERSDIAPDIPDDLLIEPDLPDRTLADPGLSTGSPGLLYMGRIFTHSLPVRLWWNKYYIPYSLHTGQYPPYAGGAGYLLSNQALLLLDHASPAVPLFPIDDAYVGMVAEAAGVPATHHRGFLSREYSSTRHPCFNLGLLVLHKLEPKDLVHLWRLYQTQGHTCGGPAQPGLT
ncbi:acetylgalactosaminyl-O-glycosyl-glycoprotein beta-1,3-N-acetylglucosaminyltransferase-like isoform X2 [Osmerus eperlanus]|uniref:acetylgalactosaminyl-O-glycosyl-glycoprotein beta-1,3-N-acetylglucosaminyltransferase-like isoform X2 n=1 Tax=Osmerus eperlanus TaxID=29151 RepID=UPI002E0F7EC5